MKLALPLLLLLFLMGCAASPPPPPKAAPPYKGIQKIYPSGLRLVAHELPDTSQMALSVAIGVGAADEPEDKPGLASLASVMTFFARPGGPTAPPLIEQFAALGGKPKPMFSHDGTGFGFVVPVAQFPFLAALGAAWMRDPLANITEEDFLKAREVAILTLQRAMESRPAGVSQIAEIQKVIEAVLPGHPYGRNAFGSPESLQRLTLEDVRAFVAMYYRPERAVVTTIGPVPLEDVTFVVARSFQPLTVSSHTEQTPAWKRTPPSPPRPPAPALSPARVPGPVKQPHLWLVWTVPGLASGNRIQARYSLGMMRHVLSNRLKQDQPSRLVEHLFLERDGLSLAMIMVELKDEQEAPAVLEQALAALSFRPSLERTERLKEVQRILINAGYSTDLASLPTGDVANVLRAKDRWDYLRVLQEQLEETLEEGSMARYMDQYLPPGGVRKVLAVPEK